MRSRPKRRLCAPRIQVRLTGVGVLPVVPLDRAPVVDIAEAAVAADIEDREATLANVRAVGAGNLQDVKADVLAEIRTLGIVMHPRAAEIGVQQEGWSDD